MKFCRGVLTWGVLGMTLLGAPAACSANGPVPIASDGEMLVDLVLDPDLGADVSRDFARVLRAMTGAEPVVAEQKGERPSIVAGTKSFRVFAGAYDELPDDDSFRITVADSDIHLVGGTRQSAHFAIYAFLEDLGCRWYMPQEIGEVIPETPDVTWPGPPRLEQPDFSYRQIWWAYGGPQETARAFRWWLLRNRVAFPRIGHGHNLAPTVPPETYFDDHPEYYALVNGERQPTQPCTTNPDVIRLSIEHVNEFFDRNPDALSYSLCPEDNRDFCECPNCTALDTGAIEAETGKPIITDRLIVYMNAVAQGIQERHPGKMVTTYAYVNYSSPPVREPIDPHVVVVFTTSVYCSGHGIGDPDCASRQTMREHLAGWAKACDNVYIYEYDPTPGNAELPFPMFGTHARAMPVYRDMGIRGFSFESHNSWATLFPNHYVSARLMWDADQDYNVLMDDVCRGFFGRAAAPMRTYYDELDRTIRTQPEIIEWGQDKYPSIFTDAVVAKCRSCLEEARSLAVDSDAVPRVEMVSMGFEYLENYLLCRNAAARHVSFDEYRSARRRCEDLIDRMYAINKDYIMAAVARDYFNQELGSLESALFARELGLVTHWMVLGPFDHTGRRGHDEPYPPEQAVDFSQSYTGKDGVTIKWLEHENPDWAGMVDLALLVSPKDWTTGYAVCYVTSPREQEVQFRVGSNDSVKVWLNDTEVWDNPIFAGRGVILDDDVFPVTLPAGTSRLMLKVSNLGKNWGFCFRITDSDGNAVEGLDYGVSP